MLNSSTAGQLLVFLANVFWGLSASLCTHILIVATKKIDKILRIVIEASFSALTLFLLWYANFVFNYGQFRLYLVFGFAMGCFAYFTILSSTLDKAFDWLYNFTYKKKVSRVDNESDIPK